MVIVSNLFPISLSLVQILIPLHMAHAKLILQQPYQKQSEKGKTDSRPKVLNPVQTRLYLYLIVDRNNIAKIKTEHFIYPKDWDFKNQEKKEIKGNVAGTPEENEKIRTFNKDLRKLKDDTETEYRNLKKQYPDMSFSQIAEILKKSGKAKENPFLDKKKSFFDILDDYIVYLGGVVAPGTIKKFHTLKLSLQEFVKVNKKYELLTFSMIDHNFIDAYISYLRNQEPRGRQKSRPKGFQEGLLTNTVGKYVECVKTFCKWSQERGYNHNNTYKEFSNFSKADKKRKKQDHDIVTLSLSEFRQFYTFDFSKAEDLKPEKQKTLERVRDLFCFGCFTVQRWSDIDRFEKSQIQGDVWTFEAFKTKKETEIDLIGYAAGALDIIKKYDYQLPKISLTKFNLYVKEAAKAAKIDSQVKIRRYVGSKLIEISKLKCEFIGSHTARKTGVSILLNDYNVPITHVLRITQHSDLKTLQKYINTDRTARRNAMSKTKSITEPLTIVKQKAG